MPEAFAAPFEAGCRTQLRPRHVAAPGARGLKPRLGVAHREHLPGVLLPVGGEPQDAAALELLRDARDEVRRDQAAFVVALLVPWVREEHQHLVEAPVRQAIAQHFDRVAADHAQIAEPASIGAQQQPPDAGTVHFDAEIVDLRIGLRQRADDLARAEADLDAAQRAASEHGVQIQHPRGFQTVCRPELHERAFLRRGDAAGAQDEAAYAAWLHGRAVCLI